MTIFINNKKMNKFHFKTENDFEREIIKKSNIFFGQNSLYIDVKKKLSTETLGGVIPDGFLIDFQNTEDLKFYIVEIELSSHSFNSHIFPQITKFIAFIKNTNNKSLLIDEMYRIINENKVYKEIVNKFSNTNDIYKFLNDLIKHSENILVIIDDEKPEFSEISKTYSEWRDLVKVIIIQKYNNSDDIVYYMEPEFEELDYFQSFEIDNNVSILTEEQQLDSVKCGVKDLYNKLKHSLLDKIPNLVFNPQKYYISLRTNKNHVYIKGKKRWLDLVIMKEEDKVRRIIENCEIKTLSASVQKFYSGSCTSVRLNKENQIKEIVHCINVMINS